MRKKIFNRFSNLSKFTISNQNVNLSESKKLKYAL